MALGRGGDRGGGGYGGSGKGNSGPGAGGRGGGNGSSGGIGGSGVGWSGSGAQSRSDAAHAGADFGGQPGTVGGGGRSSGRGSGSASSGSTARGPDTTVGIGRRSSAMSAFGRIGQAVSDAWGGLTQGIADVGQSVGESLGYGYDKAPTFTGSQDLAALNAHTQAQMEKGESLAQRDQAVNTVASPVGLNTLTSTATNALSNTLSPTAQMSYDATQEKGLGSLAKTGINTAAAFKGIPNPVTATLTNAISYKLMTDQDEATQATKSSRRSNAVAAFNPGRGSSGSQISPALASQPQVANNPSWEPASYGLGDYGSHVKGLLG